MADRVATLNSYMDAAIAAQAVGDYATAINNALAAQGMIASLPRLSRAAGAGGGSQSAEWDSEGIDKFIVRLRQQQASTTGVQIANKTFVAQGYSGTW